MVVVVLLLAVPLVLLGLLLASFVITRQAVANAAAALERELPSTETIVARAAANCLRGDRRGMGTLVLTDRSLRFRGARARETLVVHRRDIDSVDTRAEGNREVLVVGWTGGGGTWRVADPAPLAAELARR